MEGVVTKLTSKIDLAAAKSAELKGEVKTLSAELAALADEQASMDSIRAEEKAAFDKAKAELSAGIAGVQKAIGVLRWLETPWRFSMGEAAPSGHCGLGAIVSHLPAQVVITPAVGMGVSNAATKGKTLRKNTMGKNNTALGNLLVQWQ